MFNKGDKVIIRHKDKNGKSQFSWETRIVTLGDNIYHIHEAMPNRCLFHDENRCWVFNADNCRLEYKNLKER